MKNTQFNSKMKKSIVIFKEISLLINKNKNIKFNNNYLINR